MSQSRSHLVSHCHLTISPIITIQPHRFLTSPRRRRMSTFEPIKFIPSSDKARILSSAVTEIWAVGHAIDFSKEGGNHWCCYLQLPDGTSSVRIDITPTLRGAFHHHPGRIEGEYGNQLARVQDFKGFDDRLKTAGPRKPHRRGCDWDFGQRRGPSVRIQPNWHWVQSMGQHAAGPTFEQRDYHQPQWGCGGKRCLNHTGPQGLYLPVG